MTDEVKLTDDISEAHALLALQSKLKKNPGIQAAARSHGIPIYVTKVTHHKFCLVLRVCFLVSAKIFLVWPVLSPVLLTLFFSILLKTSASSQLTKAIRALIADHAHGFKDFDFKDNMNSSQKIDALEVRK